MRWGRTLMALAGALTLVACAEQPTRELRAASMQEELRSADHWQVLAAQTARQIKASVAGGDAAAKPFYVAPLDRSMVFGRLFERSLVTALVAEGLPVSLTRDDAYRVHLSLDVVPHSRGINPPPTGSLVLLGAGVWALEHYLTDAAADAVLSDAVLPLTIFEAARFFKVFGKLSDVAITVSVVDGTQLVARAESTYYVEGDEIAQYAATRPAPPLVVRDPAWAREPMPVRDFPVSGQ